MGKQARTVETQGEKKHQHRLPLAEKQNGVADWLTGPVDIFGGSIESQVMTLERMPTVKRRAAVVQIGRVQGNQHVQRVVAAVHQNSKAGTSSSRPQDVQARFAATEPDEQYDQAVEDLVQMFAPAFPPPPSDEGNHGGLHYRHDGRGTTVALLNLESRIEGMKGNGKPLPRAEQAFFEGRIGVDFSDVYVHTGDTAVQAARDANVRADGVGADVGFNVDKYADQSVFSQKQSLHMPSIQKQDAGVTHIEFTEKEAMVIAAGELTEEEIKLAIEYNKARGYSIAVIKTIQRTVGTKDDGIIGPNTIRKIAGWQVQKGLRSDGKVGPKTLTAILDQVPKEQIKKIEKRPKLTGKERPGAERAYIIKKKGVVVTSEIQRVLDELEDYFRQADLRVRVTSAVRSPRSQLRIIIRKAKAYGLDKKYPSILNATVDDIESWRGAWDELLNIKGFIVNPPKPAKCKLGKRKGRTIYPSPHIRKKAFDLAGAPLDSIKAVIMSYKKDGGPIGQILVENTNNCVHIGIR